MFNFGNINFATIFLELFVSLLATGIVAFVTYLLCKRYGKHIRFAKKMKNFGFVKFLEGKDIDYDYIFKEGDNIKMMFVSAFRFFNDDNKIQLIEEAARNKKSIQFLFAKKQDIFFNDIMEIEWKSGSRESNQLINDEVDFVYNKIQSIKERFPESRIEVKYYSTEYRLPFILADFTGKKGIKTNVWLNLTLIPKLSNEHLLLYGELEHSSDLACNKEYHIVKMAMEHFNCIWARSLINKENINVKEKNESKIGNKNNYSKANGKMKIKKII